MPLNKETKPNLKMINTFLMERERQRQRETEREKRETGRGGILKSY